MKTKYLLFSLATLLVGGGVWSAKILWRVRSQLVSLVVHSAPLREVLRKIERQTWKKIDAEQALDARITLQVRDRPLNEVLDRIAQQAGAHWCTVYAVYDSSPPLRKLETALRSDGKLDTAGWTKLAPQPPPPEMVTPNGPPGAGHRMFLVRHAQDGPSVFQGAD